ncbi:MAG: hypothetical protein HW388_955 [Dehalococcoidia bacterium]|nr:hypothetical protein [Dehalococcoidia bacterium]
MELEARVAAIVQETPSVKSFVLELDREFTFLPGQYVDLSIYTPEGTVVAGYSITSTPLQKRVITIAVKRIPDARAATSLHERAQVGDTFTIMGPGGGFYYQREMGDSLVLIAGGIGITPLMSMVRYVHEARLPVDATLLYSAQCPSELAFLEELRAISAQSTNIRCFFTVTRPQGEYWEGRVGRIDREMLREHTLRRESLFYICGPGEMPRQMSELLRGLGVDSSRIKTERW